MADDEEPIDDAAAADEWAAMLDDEEGEGDASDDAEPAKPSAEDTENMSKEDLAALEAMAEDDDSDLIDDSSEGEDEADERVLNQDEIDLLLGFESDDDGGIDDTGIEAILGKALMAYEKLPMLEVVFDRLVRILSSSMRSFTSDNVDISIDSMVSLKFDDYLNSIPLPAMLVVFRAVEWENFGIVTVDSSLIYSIVDVLLGGRRATQSIRVEGRPYTTIEQGIVKKLVDVILSDMSIAFDPLSPVSFQHERLENNPRFATITRPNNAALLIKLKVDMEGRGGMIELLFPHITLEPIRDMLMQIFIGEDFGQDAVWEKHFGDELMYTDVDVAAVLDEKKISMGDIMAFKVGSTLMLDVKPNSDISLKCGNTKVTTAKLGRLGDNIAVSIIDKIHTVPTNEGV